MSKKTKKDASSPVDKPRKIALIALIVLSLAGLAVSFELTRIHYLTHTSPTYHSVCAINEQVNCETVAQSPFSVFCGVPVSVWGVLGYAVMILLGWSGFSKRRLHATWPDGLLLSTAFFSIIVSSLLAFISVTRIDAICLFCTSLYAINILIFTTHLIFARNRRTNPLTFIVRDVRTLIGHLKLSALLIALVGGAVTGLILLIPPYWHHAGWNDLKELPHGVTKDGSHYIGAENPLITVVEFTDYQCPFCRRAHKGMRLLAARYPNEVRLVHKHLPLDSACNKSVSRSLHKRACEFSKAVECAGKQGKYWAMNDALFSIQDYIKSSDVDPVLLSVQLGLDNKKFKKCFERKSFPAQIKRDIIEARKRKVRGTPTFFIRSQRYMGGLSGEILDNAVKQERKKFELKETRNLE